MGKERNHLLQSLPTMFPNSPHDHLMVRMKSPSLPPHIPHHFFKKPFAIELRAHGATIRLRAELALNKSSIGNSSPKPSTDVRVLICRNPTRVFLTADSPDDYYVFPARLVTETCPFFSARCSLRASRLCHPSQYSATDREDNFCWIPHEFPLVRSHRENLEAAIRWFLCKVVTERTKEGFEFLTMDISVTIDSNVVQDGEIGGLKNVSTDNIEDRLQQKNHEEEVQCAVCLEEVKKLSSHYSCFCCSRCQFELGVELCCSHAFHLRCIEPWLARKNSCPMCRCEQRTFRLGTEDKDDVEAVRDEEVDGNEYYNDGVLQFLY